MISCEDRIAAQQANFDRIMSDYQQESLCFTLSNIRQFSTQLNDFDPDSDVLSQRQVEALIVINQKIEALLNSQLLDE